MDSEVGGPHKEKLLELIFLNECKARPCSGKEIMQKVASMTGGTWKPSAGSVYPVIKGLEQAGMVNGKLEGQKRGRREIKYATSAKGIRELKKGRAQLEERFEMFFSSMMPLFTKITHDLSDEEVEEMKKDSVAIREFRRKMLSAPKSVRKKAMSQLSKVFRDESLLLGAK